MTVIIPMHISTQPMHRSLLLPEYPNEIINLEWAGIVLGAS